MEWLYGAGIAAMERGWLPDWLVRWASRALIAQTLSHQQRGASEAQVERKEALVQQLRAMPIAIKTEDANAQHYAVPTPFFVKCLGPRLKYSCCLFREKTKRNQTKAVTGITSSSLDAAEEDMLALYCDLADLGGDGTHILDLGCGWGSLSLYLAEKFPKANIWALSNSTTQREYIETKAKHKGFRNLRVHTGDVSVFEGFKEGTFDRIVSIEMFEHMKNYEELLGKISRWLKPSGTLFVHIFAHMQYAYQFKVESSLDWMTKYFFEGGTMASHDLLLRFQNDLRVRKTWRISGLHYAETSRRWLHAMDANRTSILKDFEGAYGAKDCKKWFARWRTFYIAVEELFRYRNGEEWGISMYLFEK